MNFKNVSSMLAGSLVIYILVACTSDTGVPDVSADQPTSGLRIRARFAVTASADGASYKAFAGWHDTKLDIDCVAATASDGTTRCLPTTGAEVETEFLDSSCSQRVVRVPAGAFCAPHFASKTSTAAVGTCGIPGTRVEFFSVGAAIALPANSYVLDTANNVCGHGAGFTAKAGTELRAVAKVEAYDFAQMTITSSVE